MENNQKFINGNDLNKKRLLSIDILKGITILLMIFVNIIAKYHAIPDWNKHGVGYTVTYVDLVLPLFLFMMTLNFKDSYIRRLDKGSRKEAFIHFIRRYLIFIGIGFIFTIDFYPLYLRWGPLQVLGLSGLFLLLIIEFSAKIRLVIGGVLILTHQLLILPMYSEVMSDLWAGGIYSCIGWGGMMLISSVITESLHSKRLKENLLISSLLLISISFLFLPMWGMSMTFTTIPYILFSLGICTLGYLAAYILFDEWGQKRNYFQGDNLISILGKNAFILYILHVIFRLITSTLLSADTEITIILSAVLINGFVLCSIAYILNRNKKYVII